MSFELKSMHYQGSSTVVTEGTDDVIFCKTSYELELKHPFPDPLTVGAHIMHCARNWFPLSPQDICLISLR